MGQVSNYAMRRGRGTSMKVRRRASNEALHHRVHSCIQQACVHLVHTASHRVAPPRTPTQ